MAELYNRYCSVTVGTTQISGLRIVFKCARNLTSDPNTAEIQIYNLSHETRSKLQEPKIPVSLQAGYDNSYGQLFLGFLRTPSHVRNGSDMITTFKAGDGENQIRQKRTNISFKAGAGVGQVLESLANEMRINATDAIRKLKSGQIRGGLTQFVKGATFSGRTWDELQRLLNTTGLEGSIQDGILQVTEKNAATSDKAVVINADSGMIGSPEVGDKGKLKVRTLMQSSIYPGRQLRIIGQWQGGNRYAIDAFYRAETVMHIGDTRGNDWFTDVEARPL